MYQCFFSSNFSVLPALKHWVESDMLYCLNAGADCHGDSL